MSSIWPAAFLEWFDLCPGVLSLNATPPTPSNLTDFRAGKLLTSGQYGIDQLDLGFPGFVRAYHGDWISEKRFQRWFLPEGLPDTRPSTSIQSASSISLQDYAGRKRPAQRTITQPTPVTSLMLIEVERRIDVFIFRCCFATSAWQARQLVVHGKVKLNGKKQTNPNTLLNPGDMVSVDPAAIDMLRVVKSPVEDTSEDQTITASVTSNSPKSRVVEGTNSEEGQELKNAGSKTSASNSSPVSSTTRPRSALEDAPKTFLDPETKATVLNHRGTSFSLPAYASPHLFIPAYIEPAFNTCSAVYVRHPTARPGYSEIPSPFGADGEVMRFTWEWYKRVRPRMRSRKDTWINPSGERGNWKMVQ